MRSFGKSRRLPRTSSRCSKRVTFSPPARKTTARNEPTSLPPAQYIAHTAHQHAAQSNRTGRHSPRTPNCRRSSCEIEESGQRKLARPTGISHRSYERATSNQYQCPGSTSYWCKCSPYKSSSNLAELTISRWPGALPHLPFSKPTALLTTSRVPLPSHLPSIKLSSQTRASDANPRQWREKKRSDAYPRTNSLWLYERILTELP